MSIVSQPHSFTARRLLYVLSIAATIVSFSACKDLTSVIESQSFSTPHMDVVSPSHIDTIDTHTLPPSSGLPSDNVVITVTIKVKAYDSVGITGVSGSVSTPFFAGVSQGSSTLANFALQDNGQGPDETAGDSIFTGTVSFEIFRYEVGLYRVTLQAANTIGTVTPQHVVLLQVINSGNHPPKFESVAATPDTLTLADTLVASVLTAKITDPENQKDILTVTTQATKPDGSLSNTIVTMYDDGDPAHADAVAGDGIYSSGIKLDPNTNPPPEKGDYLFRFVATDKSYATSTDSLHFIVK